MNDGRRPSLTASKDDQSYSAQGKAEDLHGELLAFPGGRGDDPDGQMLVLWDTEYTTW